MWIYVLNRYVCIYSICVTDISCIYYMYNRLYVYSLHLYALSYFGLFFSQYQIHGMWTMEVESLLCWLCPVPFSLKNFIRDWKRCCERHTDNFFCKYMPVQLVFHLVFHFFSCVDFLFLFVCLWGGSCLVMMSCIWVIFMWKASSHYALSASAVRKDEKTFDLFYVWGPKSQ